MAKLIVFVLAMLFVYGECRYKMRLEKVHKREMSAECQGEMDKLSDDFDKASNALDEKCQKEYAEAKSKEAKLYQDNFKNCVDVKPLTKECRDGFAKLSLSFSEQIEKINNSCEKEYRKLAEELNKNEDNLKTKCA